MKAEHESQALIDAATNFEHHVEAALNRLGMPGIVRIYYDAVNEYFDVSIDDEIEVHKFAVNVNADAVLTSMGELVRELIIHIAQEYRNHE